MTRLEDLQPAARVRLLSEQVVSVVSAQRFGYAALKLPYKGPSGRVPDVYAIVGDQIANAFSSASRASM